MESYAYAADVSSYKDEFKANNVLDAVQNYQRTSGGATLYLNNTYGDVFSKFTLQSSEEYSSLYPEKRTVSYRYDSKWNPVEVTTPDNMSVVYLWGYKYSLPIARLKGITYAEVVSRLNRFGCFVFCRFTQYDGPLCTENVLPGMRGHNLASQSFLWAEGDKKSNWF